jgi:hypothetical protein
MRLYTNILNWFEKMNFISKNSVYGMNKN